MTPTTPTTSRSALQFNNTPEQPQEPETERRYTLCALTVEKGNPSYDVMGVNRAWRFSKKKMDELIRQGRIIQVKPGAIPRYKRYLDEIPPAEEPKKDDVPTVRLTWQR